MICGYFSFHLSATAARDDPGFERSVAITGGLDFQLTLLAENALGDLAIAAVTGSISPCFFLVLRVSRRPSWHPVHLPVRIPGTACAVPS